MCQLASGVEGVGIEHGEGTNAEDSHGEHGGGEVIAGRSLGHPAAELGGHSPRHSDKKKPSGEVDQMAEIGIERGE